MKNIAAIIVYHANCLDGFAAALAAWLKFGNDALYIPAHYGDQDDINKILDECRPYRHVYILDFSFPLDVLNQIEQASAFVTMLDHHKTAFEMFNAPLEIPFESKSDKHYYQLNNSRSGCILAFTYFWPADAIPLAFYHIDDRDRWQFKMQGTKEFNAALWNRPRAFEHWHEAFQPEGITALYQEGQALLIEQANHVEACVKRARVVALFDQAGHIVNTDKDISEVGHALCAKNGTFGLIWYIDNKGMANCNLRSNGDYDVSVLAKQFGGGGHKNAAGFRLTPAQLIELI